MLSYNFQNIYSLHFFFILTVKMTNLCFEFQYKFTVGNAIAMDIAPDIIISVNILSFILSRHPEVNYNFNKS